MRASSSRSPAKKFNEAKSSESSNREEQGSSRDSRMGVKQLLLTWQADEKSRNIQNEVASGGMQGEMIMRSWI